MANIQESISETRAAIQFHNHTLDSVLRSTAIASESSTYPEPATSLEVSPHFFPETYTMESRIPRSSLTIIAAHELYDMERATVNVYRLLYFKAPRQWHWLTLSIRISHESRYWPMTKITSAFNMNWGTTRSSGPASMPLTLLTKIRNVLGQLTDSRDKAKLLMTLQDSDIIDNWTLPFLKSSISNDTSNT